MYKYSLVAKLYHNNELVGYRLLDKNNLKCDVDLLDVKILVNKGLIKGVTLDKQGILHGSSTVDLRRIPHESIFKNNISTFEVGNKIQDRFNFCSKFKKRYCFQRLVTYLRSNTNKVCTVYGLRRTGKTVLLLQAINYLGFKNCAYISLNKKDTSRDLLSTLNNCYSMGIRYVFIDEITVLDDILYFIQTLADNYTSKGMHIVISGTDSYILNVASKGALYNRCTMIRTTYISFGEYNHLFGMVSIGDYIHYGGVLNRDSFYDIDSMHEYLSTAISDNIQRSIEILGRGKYGKLYDLIEMGLFKRCLELAIQHTNEEITAWVLTKEYKSHEVGSVSQLLSSVLDVSTLLDVDVLTERIRYCLKVSNIGGNTEQNYNLVSEYFDAFMSLLKELDLIVYAKRYIGTTFSNSIIFTMAGLRYNQLKEVICVFFRDNCFQKLSKKDRNLIIRKIESDVYGQLAEQTVLLEMISRFGYDKVYKFSSMLGEEVDCIIEMKTGLALIKVKWDKNAIKDQCIHLINKDFNSLIEKVTGYKILERIVVYRGETKQVNVDGLNIHYVNINSFLLSPEVYL